MKQNHEIRFKCTAEEHNLIKQKANRCGMTIKSFLLWLGKTSTIEILVSNSKKGNHSN